MPTPDHSSEQALPAQALSVMEALSASKKYGTLCPALVARICAEEASKFKRDKERIHAAKNRLHQVYGAFLTVGNLQRAEAALGMLERGECDLPTTSRTILSLHASTAERLPSLSAMCAFLREHLGAITSLQDIGCGMHPFSFPFLGIPTLRAYHAFDVNLQAVSLINRFFAAVGLPPLAKALDVVTQTPQVVTDAALLMKLLPVLDAQRKGCAHSLLRDVRARKLVVTFPTKSLSGREKGMGATYATAFEAGLDAALRVEAKATFGSELVYIVAKNMEEEVPCCIER